jgi:hypothetical protein
MVSAAGPKTFSGAMAEESALRNKNDVRRPADGIGPRRRSIDPLPALPTGSEHQQV